MTRRAPALSPDERRAALVEATLPLLREHGREVTTRQIARAAGVAEGTIFRAFATKEELIEACVAAVFDPARFEAGTPPIDPGLPLEERLVALVTQVQHRFTSVFGFMAALGLFGPPAQSEQQQRRVQQAYAARVAEAVGPDAGLLRIDVEELGRVLRILTFAFSHPDISDGVLKSPREIVDLLLRGALRDPPRHHCEPRPTPARRKAR